MLKPQNSLVYRLRQHQYRRFDEYKSHYINGKYINFQYQDPPSLGFFLNLAMSLHLLYKPLRTQTPPYRAGLMVTPK